MRWAEIDFWYHLMYRPAQRIGLLGKWSLAEEAHLRSISSLKPDITRPVRLMLCGTATEINPADLQKALRQTNIPDGQIVTVDLSFGPLNSTDRTLRPVQADARRTPFLESSFDVITTDFLLNIFDLSTLIEVAQSWGSALKDGGIVTTTVYTEKKNSFARRIYEAGASRLGYKFFYSREILQLIFESAGLGVSLERSKLAKRPWFYTSEFYDHLSARKINPACRGRLQLEAQTKIDEAKLIAGISRPESGRSPRSFKQALDDILKEGILHPSYSRI